MFKKFIWLFVVLPLGVLLVALALANRHMVRLSLDPFSASDPFLALDAPLFLYLLGSLLLGLFLGGTLTWLKQGKWRKAARQGERETNTLQAKNRQLDDQLNAIAVQRIERTEAAE